MNAKHLSKKKLPSPVLDHKIIFYWSVMTITSHNKSINSLSLTWNLR